MVQKVDVLVLGAGIIGVSAALHLAKRGRNVALVDRREPGEETSHGNAGVIEREGFVPITFPDSLRKLIRYALNRAPEAHYHRSELRKAMPWLAQLRANSDSIAIDRFARAVDQLERYAVREHHELSREAQAGRYFRSNGWLHLYRTAASFAETDPEMHYARIFGAAYEVLDREALRELEPHLMGRIHKAIHWQDSASVSSPGDVTKAYADLFRRRGGQFVIGDAKTFEAKSGGWMVTTREGRIWADHAVIALGPWSPDVLKPLGYDFPLLVKRGYHMHYRPLGGAYLNRPVLDSDNGYVITPMERGVRLTTGIEFADRDAPPTPVQIARTRAYAEKLFPIDVEVDGEPWMGSRPCFADSLPIISRSPRHENLWLDFGHGHIGFTTGPISGRLLAEMMSGETPLVDMTPYEARRFLQM